MVNDCVINRDAAPRNAQMEPLAGGYLNQESNMFHLDVAELGTELHDCKNFSNAPD